MYLCYCFYQLGSLRIWYSFWLIMLVSSHWPHEVPHPGWVNSKSGQELCRKETWKSFSPVPCACSCVFSCHSAAHSGICTHRIQQHWGCMTWKALTEIRLKTCFLQSWLLVCLQGVSTKEEHWRWLQARADLKEGPVWGCLVGQLTEKIGDLQRRAKSVTPTTNCCCCRGGFCSIWYYMFLL